MEHEHQPRGPIPLLDRLLGSYGGPVGGETVLCYSSHNVAGRSITEGVHIRLASTELFSSFLCLSERNGLMCLVLPRIVRHLTVKRLNKFRVKLGAGTPSQLRKRVFLRHNIPATTLRGHSVYDVSVLSVTQ